MATRGPDIFNYNDFGKFLSDFQKYHCKQSKQYGKSSLSKLLGLPSARSYFGDVTKGKKVSPLFIDQDRSDLGKENNALQRNAEKRR